MPPPARPAAESDVASRLRAAGCVFAEEEARLLLTAAAAADLDALVTRRAAGEPLEHLLGWAEFAGTRVAVGPGVFVPRRRTELLVEEAIALARPGAVVVDLCCGSGALGLAVSTAVPGVELHASDVDPAAVACARQNLAAVGGTVHEGDLFAALPAHLCGRIDVLLANVPYVPTAEIPLLPAEARDHEPRTALDGGDDGLAVLRRVATAAAAWLAAGGTLLSEISRVQAPAATAALARAGLHAGIREHDERGATVVVGTS